MPRSRTANTGIGAAIICSIQLGCLFPGKYTSTEICHVCQRAVHHECYAAHHKMLGVPPKLHCGTSEVCCSKICLPYKADPRSKYVSKPNQDEQENTGDFVCSAGSDCDGGGSPLEHLTTCCRSKCHLVCITRCILPGCEGAGSGTAGPEGSDDDDQNQPEEEPAGDSKVEECVGGRSDEEEVVDDDSEPEESDEAEPASDGSPSDDDVESCDDAVEVMEHGAAENPTEPDETVKMPSQGSGKSPQRSVSFGKQRQGEGAKPRKPEKVSSRRPVAGDPVGPRRSSNPPAGSGARGMPASSAKTQHLARSADKDSRGAKVGERVLRASGGGGSSTTTDGRPGTVFNPYAANANTPAASTRSASLSTCPPRRSTAGDEAHMYSLLRVSASEALQEALKSRDFADQVCSSLLKSPQLEKSVTSFVKKNAIDQMCKAHAAFLKSSKTEMLQLLKGCLKPATDSWQDNAKSSKKLMEVAQKAMDASQKSMASSSKKMADVCVKMGKVKSGDGQAKAITANVVEGVGNAISKVLPAVRSGCDGIKASLLEALLPTADGARGAPTTPPSGRTHSRRSKRNGGARAFYSDEGPTPTKGGSRASTPESTKLKRKHEEEFAALRGSRSSNRAKPTPPRHSARARAAAQGEHTQDGHQWGAAHGGSYEGSSSSNPAGHHYNHAQGMGRRESGAGPGSGPWASGAAPASGPWNSNPGQGTGGWPPGSSASGYWNTGASGGASGDFGNDQNSPCWNASGDSSVNPGYEHQG